MPDGTKSAAQAGFHLPQTPPTTMHGGQPGRGMQGMSGLRYREGMGAAGKIPLVVLPGMDGSGVLLTALVECLVPFRPVQVIAFPNETPLGYDDLTAFVLQRTPSERFVVLGESFSGPIAIEVAATQQRVAGLILASSFARHPMPTLLAPLAGMLDLRWLPARLVEAALLGSADRSDLTNRLRRVLAKLPREVIRARASEVLRIDKRNRLSAVSCPILCLHGRRDRLVRRKYLDEIIALQPSCAVRTFEAPHMLLQTRPAETASEVNSFCDHL
jgi:pimeloyl-[acyl-carrier protein] methyl ester esterase